MRLSTGSIERARLNQTGTYLVNNWAVNASGFFGLSPDNTLWDPITGRGPYTRLHLHNDGLPQEGSFRNWMRNGVTLTGNQDHSYVGQKYGNVDFTDMVIHWSDNPGSSPWGTDRLKFL